MSRLIEQTNKQLAEPDNSRRRNALAHLRAAVAATMADKSLVKSKSNEAADAYRDDLAQVVRTVMASEGENFERDESLRNFARMIKDGKIVRSEQGMCGITENLGYRLEDRKTGSDTRTLKWIYGRG